MKKQLAKYFVLLGFLFLFSNSAKAGVRLTVTGDDVIIFSGPSIRYRPLLNAAKGEYFPVSPRRVLGNKNGGEFYKVLVNIRGGDKRIGYISVDDPVQIEGATDAASEDVDSYQTMALAKSAAQFSFGGLKDSDYEVAVGYLRYSAPNFYYKYFVGQLITPITGNFIGGVEIGLDHLLAGHWSVYGLVNTGFVLPATSNAIFLGSSSLAEELQSGFGFRYSAGEFAAVSLGVIQAAFFSNNNSLLSTGYWATLEVGL